MSEAKINLEKILFTEVEKYRKDFPKENMYSNEEMKEASEFKYFIAAMKEACRQVLEIAAENAELIYEEPCVLSYCDCKEAVINKQSILDTINQIE